MGAQSWLSSESAGKTPSLSTYSLHFKLKDVKSSQRLQMLSFKLKMFYLRFNHQMVVGGEAPQIMPASLLSLWDLEACTLLPVQSRYNTQTWSSFTHLVLLILSGFLNTS